jgi:uncharacterized membrane protein
MMLAAGLLLILRGAAAAPVPEGYLSVKIEVEQRVAVPRSGVLSLRGTVRNYGTSVIQGIALSVPSLNGWTVIVDPESFEELGPGEQRTFQLQVSAPRAIFSRKYIQVKAQAPLAPGTFRQSLYGFYAVLPLGKTWVIVVVSLVVLAIAGFIFVYRRLSRD